jgi:hypothetical protein
MVAATWGTQGMVEGKDVNKMINGINADFEETLEAVNSAFSNRVVPEEEKLDKSNPFFAAADRGLAKVDARIRKLKGEPEPEETEEEKIDYMEGLDQG